jgi:hypothetical protein
VPLRSPEFWRARAEEARIVAEGMNGRGARDTMLQIAAQYEELARLSERFRERFGNVKWADSEPWGGKPEGERRSR